MAVNVDLPFAIPAGAAVRLSVLEQVLHTLSYTLQQTPGYVMRKSITHVPGCVRSTALSDVDLLQTSSRAQHLGGTLHGR